MAKILIIDDEQPLRESYDIILSSAGHTTQTAIHGEDAISVLEEFIPDIILLDIDMPVLDGIGFLQSYDIPKKLPDCKVIVFTNLEETKRLDEAYKLGADRYVLKSSLSPRDLIELVTQLMA